MSRVRIVVTGVVQGVGFRYFTYALARRLGLDGYVRNRMDGAVEAEAEGDEGAVNAFVAELRTGPGAAHVRGVDVVPLEPGGEYDGFEVRL